MAAYAASKGGVQSMTHALAAEYAKQGIRFTAVQPGSISSGMTDGSGQSGQSRGPGLPEDADMSLFMKLAPAIGQGFAGLESVAGVVAMLAEAPTAPSSPAPKSASTAAPTSERRPGRGVRVHDPAASVRPERMDAAAPCPRSEHRDGIDLADQPGTRARPR
jgi:NAD(P)-dependent dehydrogenase (short-subunit alcohol dehydrogenase family)